MRDLLLLRLPAELRIKIYGYVLGYKHIYPNYPQPLRGNVSRQPRLVCDCDGARDEKAHSRTKACFSAPLQLQLLSTCRRIYLEAFPILWATNVFCFEESYLMFLTFQSLAPHQVSLIRNVRLDINHFVRGNEWEMNLRNSNLTSLQGLRNLELVFNTHKPYISRSTIRFRSPHLVDSVLKLSVQGSSFAVVSTRHGRVYRTSDPNELAKSSKREQRLKRMQNMLVDKKVRGSEKRHA